MTKHCVTKRRQFQKDLLRLQPTPAPEWTENVSPAKAAQAKIESIELLHEVLDKYADVTITKSRSGFRQTTKLGEKAAKTLHALEHLSLGCAAPKTVGVDLDGQPLDLSQHRGKVVVLVFWFTGCGACMAELPQEKQLVEKYKNQPFALLSVSSDPSPELAKKTAKEYHMDWPCWFDGQRGPIAHDWNVLGWPTVYVLDKGGIIRGKHLRDETLDAKVAELMKETK